MAELQWFGDVTGGYGACVPPVGTACADKASRSIICHWDSLPSWQASSTSDRNDDVKLLDRVLNPREIRRRLGLNQEQFWTQIGVTQSGGSRYESGRDMPKPVRELLRLVHVEQIDLSEVKRIDFEVIRYLKDSHPDLYRSLRRAVRSRHRPAGAPSLDIDEGEEMAAVGSNGNGGAAPEESER